MLDISGYKHHPALQEISQIVATETLNGDLPFFRTITAYYFCTVASHMHTTVRTMNDDEWPTNAYALCLAPSGTDKGRTVHILENKILSGYRKRFLQETQPGIAELSLHKTGIRRAARKGTSEDEEIAKLTTDASTKGAMLFSFDSATSAAIKQVRELITMTHVGSLTFQIDEIGMNFTKIAEELKIYLELYDMGSLKPKLIKHSTENKRISNYDGMSPANMLAFGSDVKLFDGGKIQAEFIDFLNSGYARRYMYATGNAKNTGTGLTPKERIAKISDPAHRANIAKWNTHFTHLADISKHNWTIGIPDDVKEAFMTYEDWCKERGSEFPEYKETFRLEMINRHSKVLKLAGAFAFIDECIEVQMFHLEAAIKLIEESGLAFNNIMTRDEGFAKLARFLASVQEPVTHVDIMKHLPFYKSTASMRQELMNLATTWGYKNHIIIKKTYSDNIEWFQGETLEETDIDDMHFSMSDHFAYNYEVPDVKVPFTELHKMTQQPGFHYSSHAFRGDHRHSENVIPGFNMLVFDIDGTTSLQTVHDLLKDYTYMTYTTKRHTPAEHRFRLLMPTNYKLALEQEEFREFMANIRTWLPFDTDPASEKIAGKWTTFSKGTYNYNQGRLFDVLPFVPKTSRNDDLRDENKKLHNLDSLERWFAQNISPGNRNDLFFRFAAALQSEGLHYPEIEGRVLDFNKKLKDGLTEDELRKTVLVTIAKKFHNQP